MNLPELMTISDVERAARAKLDEAVWACVSGGAGSERIVRANVVAFEAVWLQPRVLNLVTPYTTPNTSVRLFGNELSMPALLAPTSP